MHIWGESTDLPLFVVKGMWEVTAKAQCPWWKMSDYNSVYGNLDNVH